MVVAQDVVFAANPDAMWIYDCETLRILRVNRAAICSYRLTEAEFLTKTIGDISASEAGPVLHNRLFKPAEGSPKVQRAIHRRADGSTFPVEIWGFDVTFAGQSARAVTARDITDIVSAEYRQSVLDRAVEREARLRRLAGRIARMGVWQADLVNQTLHWSDETAAIHGHPPGYQPDLESIFDAIVPSQRGRVAAAFRKCAKSGTGFNECHQIITAKGERRWVRSVGEAEWLNNKVISIQGGFQDIDELVQARLGVEKLERQLEQTLDDIGEGFILINPDWTIAFINTEAAGLLGRERLEILGGDMWAAFPDAVGSPLHSALKSTMETQIPSRFEGLYKPLNRRFEVRLHPGANGLAVHFQDVTQARTVLELAQTNEERFHLVAKVANDVIWDRDLVSNTFWWNDNLEILFGHPSTGAASSVDFWIEHIAEVDRPRVIDSLSTLLSAEGRSHWSNQYGFRRADGSIATVLDRGVVVRDGTGRAVRILGSMIDITEQLALEDRLRQSQKLEAIGQLTGGIAHDFNNVLTVILGNAEALREPIGPEDRVHLAEVTAKAATRAAELTSRLLAFARQQPLNPSQVDVDGLVQGIDVMLARILREDIALKIVPGGDGEAMALVDPGQLETAILNLVINAQDAMPEGGDLVLASRSVEPRDAFTELGDAGRDYLLVSVRDTGSGMTPEILARAFDPFFTTKEIGKGSGLGLSMVYGFAQQSGGHVRITSEPGRGTEVQIALPRSRESARYKAPAADPVALVGGSERILVVEDDTLVRNHVVRQLTGLGYEIVVAETGAEALQRVETGEPLDLLFTDVVMPGGMSGPDLAARVRDLRPDLRVLFTSGYSEEVIGSGQHSEISLNLLRKPYRRKELASRIRGALDDAVSATQKFHTPLAGVPSPGHTGADA